MCGPYCNLFGKQGLSYGNFEAYLERSNNWREKSGVTQVFLSYVKPHKPVSAKTIARWLTEVLNKAGVPTNQFKAHSYRAAGSSKAKAMGVSLKDILKQGCWKGEYVWQKHYNKSIVDKLFFNLPYSEKPNSFKQRRI